MDFDVAVAALKQAICAQSGGADDVEILDDAVLYRFAACRLFDMVSAAKRYLKFIKVVKEYQLSFEETPEIAKVLSRGIVHTGGFDLQGHPVVIAVPRYVDWKMTSTKDMQKAWFYCAWQAICSSPLAQSEGIVLMLFARGMSISFFNRDFLGFVGNAIQECLPMKIRRILVVNQPWIFSSFIAPLISPFMPAKIRERVVLTGRNYELIWRYIAPATIPKGLRGEFYPEHVRA
mmetsp:Transcript_50207/g.131954  ORF Transcript_50207/g.131954 Transcript_50207/m.131954 type:complete len:233 (+) Transcript_50207:41-739(+)